MIEQSEGNILLPDLEILCEQFDIPTHFIMPELNFSTRPQGKHEEKLKAVFEAVNKSLDAQILYLPTYRRIEQELNLIFKGLDDDELRHRHKYMAPRKKHDTYVELVEFGMKDVVRAIRSTLDQLKEFARENLNNLTLGYLGDVVDQKYAEVSVDKIQNSSDDTIENVLNRIHESILSPTSKQHLSQTIQKVKNGDNLDEHAKVICHYFIKLLDFQQELQKNEDSISRFCEVCSEYMVDKTFIYDSPSFSFNIKADCPDGNQREVELKQLSSGEKQI
ncbi:MAG: hypothetical protein D3918_17055, partial [Candidatus Electrothrix sp. AX2]|nr:hypothetical protein [Candidatus Electrothrix gigas]